MSDVTARKRQMVPQIELGLLSRPSGRQMATPGGHRQDRQRLRPDTQALQAVVVRDRWNHNIQYHSLILQALPHDCVHVLDVGCGEGTLARELSSKVRHVTAIDLDAPTIELARHTPTLTTWTTSSVTSSPTRSSPLHSRPPFR